MAIDAPCTLPWLPAAPVSGSRFRALVAALAFLALLVGAVVPAEAQQFSVRRSLDHRRSGNGQPLQNKYWISLPLQPDLPDDCNFGATSLASRCVGDPGGPVSGDGVIDSCDLLCAWWTARSNHATAGVMVVSRWQPETCEWQHVSGSWGFRDRMSVAGERFPVDPTVGYQAVVAVPVGARYDPINPIVLSGDPDPSWTGTRIFSSTTCGPMGRRGHLVVFPFDALYARAQEILCGLEGVDWVDERDVSGNPGPDGNPDTCWDDRDGDLRYDAGEPLTGVHDGMRGIGVSYWDNTTNMNGPVTRTVAPGFPAGRLSWNGPNLALVPGEAYYVSCSPGQSSLYRPPTR
jgi:hypothetical protein